MTESQGTPLLAGAYFDFLFGHDVGWACIRTWKEGRFGHPDGPVQRHWFSWPKQRDDMVGLVLANSSLDLYVIPALFGNTSSNKASNIIHQTCVYADADGATPDLFKAQPTIVLETSPGRHHLIWKTTTNNSEALTMVGRSISHVHAHQGCDKGGWDAGQLLRIPGTTNNKERGSGPYYLQAHTSGELFELSELVALYPPVQSRGTLATRVEMPSPVTWVPLDEAEEVLIINTDLHELYTFEPDYRDADGKRFRENIPFDASGRMWRFLSELSRRSVPPEVALVLAWNAGCCKYRLDGRPVENLWVELSKAYSMPENSVPSTEMEIELYLRDQALEQAKRDGIEKGRKYSFLTDNERVNCPSDTIVDRYVRWAGTVTDAAASYQRAGIMTVLSAVFGEFGSPPTKFYMGRLNLWFLVLGGTTRSRKSTARHMWLTLLRDMQEGGEYNYDIGSDITPEALAEELGDKPGWSSVFHRDEVHGLLGEQSSKGYLAGLQESMTELYDGHVRIRKRVGSIKEKKKSGAEPATTTNFVINFSGVTDHVTEVLTAADFASGYLARFLYVYAEPPKRTRQGERMEQYIAAGTKRDDMVYLEIKQELQDIRSFWEKVTPRGKPVRIPFSADAWERLNDFAWDIGTAAAESDMAKMLEPVADRMTKSVLKVACLLAMSEACRKVEIRHMYKAIELGEEWFHHMMIIASRIRESLWQQQQNDVISMLDASNGRATWTVLYKKFRGKLKPKQFEEIIIALSEAGECKAVYENRNRVVYKIGNPSSEETPRGAIPAVSREDQRHRTTSKEQENDRAQLGGGLLGVTDIPA